MEDNHSVEEMMLPIGCVQLDALYFSCVHRVSSVYGQHNAHGACEVVGSTRLSQVLIESFLVIVSLFA